VVPDLLRGRATTTPAAQAAMAHVRRLVDDPAIDALSPAGTLHLGDGVFQVRLRHGTDNLMVTLRAVARPVPGLLTCHARNEAHPPAYDVLEVTEVG
jgi:hypothetical protein